MKLRNVRFISWSIALVLGAIDAWTSRYHLNPMGISYLDMGDAFIRGDWQTALNGLWSPLYSLPLGLMNTLLRPSPKWEFPLVHLINFLIFLGALCAFEFFLRELIKWKQARQSASNKPTNTGIPDWTIMVLGYAIFMWCSLGLITMSTTAPDMLLSVFVYLAFGMLLRMENGHATWLSFFLLGLIVGFGYLTKAAMLPLGILFILIGLLLVGDLRKAGRPLAAAVLGLLLVAGPFVIALSASKHRLSTGDSGTLNYAWHVNKVPAFHWQGDPIHGTPKHPTRKIFDRPAVYEFGTPLNATYPPWYDPSYWYEGVVPRFNLNQQKAAVRWTLKGYWGLITFKSHLTLLAGFLLLLYLSRKNWRASIVSGWKLLLLPLAAVVMYLPVHVEPRYVAAFTAPFWLVLFSSLRMPGDEKTRKRVVLIMLAMSVVIVLAQTSRSVFTFWELSADPSIETRNEMQLRIAGELTRRGLKPGDAVGLVNFNPHWLAVVHWARLNRLRVVAELPNSDSAVFAESDETQRREVVEAFAKAGARVLVASNVPDDVTLAGWDRLGDTSYYVLNLDSPTTMKVSYSGSRGLPPFGERR